MLVCYLVLQHLPERRVVVRYLEEFARVLAPAGSAFVQLPVMDDGLRPALWRARAGAWPCPWRASSGAAWRADAAYRGTRLTEAELQDGARRTPACAGRA